jgi:dihydrofolate reductase
MSHRHDVQDGRQPPVGSRPSPVGPSCAAPGTGPRVYLIAAVAANRVIGARGKLPWHLPEDLKHFKALTLGRPIIMGRRTWESLGRPLPGRENIVVSRTPGYEAPGAGMASSLEHALALCAGEALVYVIGGEKLYEAALGIADGLVLTEIKETYEGDARFPAFDRSQWREAQRQPHVAEDGTEYDFVLYERIR